jgi:prepilin-type N-terminal cleavage/methylation domain-containing protein
MFKENLNQLNLKDNTRGFTLPEVLIAISIFAIGFLAVASMQISANHSNRRASDITEATAIASDNMERLMALPFDDGELSPGNHADNQGRYNLQWGVAFSDAIIDGTISTDAKTINLAVTWNPVWAGGASQRRVNIDFIKPNPIYNE